MQISEIQVDGYEKVLRCRDDDSGLHALIAVHDTTLRYVVDRGAPGQRNRAICELLLRQEAAHA